MWDLQSGANVLHENIVENRPISRKSVVRVKVEAPPLLPHSMLNEKFQSRATLLYGERCVADGFCSLFTDILVEYTCFIGFVPDCRLTRISKV